MGEVRCTGEAPGQVADPREEEAVKFPFHCRACGSKRLAQVLDLGRQPLANEFRKPEQFGQNQTVYPLELWRCEVCELVQLSAVVNPKIMYGPHYPYRSGYSEGWALHCHGLAKEIGRGKRVLEVGCLDGVMLRHCRDNGCEVLGVDPSSPVTDVPVYREFFGSAFQATNSGRYDYIVAQNVFGHVDDVHGFLEAARNNLAPEGTLIIEAPWVVDLIDGVRWDTIYHEHLSYWGVRPLMRLAADHRLSVNQVKYFPEIHGGTMRYYLSRDIKSDPHVYQTWHDEEMSGSDWTRFRCKVHEQVGYWHAWFLTHTGERVAAYGASAKLNTFLNAMPTRPPLACIFDESPAKIGLLTPGRSFQVVAPLRIHLEQIDTLLIGAANWKQQIEEKARANGFRGEVVSLWE
jgi:SAM-dependent methyltransferase